MKKRFLKPVSTLLIPCLLYTQTAWAVDVRQMITDAKALFEQEDALRPKGMAPSDLQAAQLTQQTVVNQQQALQDLQNSNFSLTTQSGDVLKYIGDKLDSVERPDGTLLKNITTDAQGNIVSSDLRLADGSIQIFQNGQVLGYQTPDGTQVLYSDGRIQKTISKAGEETLYSYTLNGTAVTETVLSSLSRQTKYDASGKIKETTRSDNQKIIYSNGIIQKIINPDGSQVAFTSQLVGGDTVVTPQGDAATFYTDTQGNKFYFTGANVSSIVLVDGSTVNGITWDAANKIDSATLTETDGSKCVYQAKLLTRAYDNTVNAVVTNYTYTATSIFAAKAGTTWEYLLDKTPVKFTALNGDITTYLQSGTYKGFKNTETLSGITYTYSYQGSGASITAQKTGPGGVSILPVSTLQTASRSSRNTSEAWFQDNTDSSLYAWYSNLFVTYNINPTVTGDLKIEFSSTNFGGNVPSTFSFQLEISVDGVVKKQHYTPAGTGWKTNSLILTGITQGAHVIKIRWANDYWQSGVYDANFKFKALKFTQTSPTTTQTVASGYQSTALTSRTDTLKNSLIVKAAAPGSINSTDFTLITYDANAALKQVLFKDGSKLLFDQGVLKQAFDATGKSTDFNFEQSALSNITGSTIVQSNLTSTYSPSGKLSSTKTGDITVHYKTDGQAIDWIEKADGTELWNLVFDAAGALKDAMIYSPDGEIRQYVAGKLTGIQKPDRTRLTYASDKPIQLITPENLTYNFTYSASAIEANLQATAVPDALTPIKMEYDLQFNLKKVTRQNQEILNYLNTDLSQITAPGNTAKFFTYQRDAAGKILSYTVTQGNVVTSYDANNNPTSAVISPTTDNPHTFNVSYSYGRIRQIKKDSVVVFNYTYTVDAQGAEIAQIEDLNEKAFKTYKDGNLLTSLNNETQVLTNYEYVSGKVSRVSVSRFGLLYHDYIYSTSGTDTLVTDDQGVIRTYDTAGKLKLLERNGEKFAYVSTTTAAPGNPVNQSTALPVSTFGTSARSSGTQSWEKWTENSAEGSLGIGTNGYSTSYTVNLSQAGDLRIDFASANFNGVVPASYLFQVAIAVDGAAPRQISAGARSAWSDNSLTLTGLTAGTHTVKLTWLNDYYVANQYDANFKFKNLQMTHLYQAQSGPVSREILVESLTEKKLADGSVIHYTNSKASQIDYADGRVFKNFVLDSEGQLTQATLFQSAGATTGTKLTFENGQLSKALLSTGQELIYTYEKDASGNNLRTWVKKGAANLRYDAQGKLDGLRIEGVLTPEEVRAAATHTYLGGVGALSIDGNFNTAQAVLAGCSGCGGAGATATSEHALSFTQPQIVQNVSFRMAVSAYAHGNYTRDYNASYRVEVLRGGTWQSVTGSTFYASGGDGEVSRDSGIINLAGINLDNVTAIRAFANGFGNASGGGGNSGGSASIYEIQYTLADLANLSFGATQNTSGQVTGYSLTGYRGSVKFDAQGALTQPNASYSSIQQELSGVIQNYASTPFKTSDFSTVLQSFSDNETVTSQEYAADGTLETQTKADGTVTLFEKNKPSQVLDRKGKLLIQYTYDADGNPTRVYLKNARDTLPDQIDNATLEIEKKRAESLRALAAQKNLAYQSIQDQFTQSRLLQESQRTILESQASQISSVEAKGKEGKSQKATTLGQIDSNIALLEGNLATLYGQEADAYAALDGQVLTLSNQIEADSQTAFTALGQQETLLKNEILRQEVSPLVYDNYRRILGRDPSTAEYNGWISQMDYNSGVTGEAKLTNGQLITQALKNSIQSSPELAERQTYVNAIKSAVTNQVNSYLAMTQAQKEAYAATLGLTAQDLVPLSSIDAANILKWLNSRSLHFGQSAFLSLESLLDQKETPYSRETLARQAILIDVLTGVISPLDDGDLVLSVFALNKTAALYSLNLVGAKLSWDDLKSVIPAQAGIQSPRAIAHINGNHFVIVTAMTNDSITYIDPGKGKDKQNESITVLKADFLKVWEGNVTLENNILNTAKQRVGSQAKILSAAETKSIRGAFLPLLFFFAAQIIANIGAAIFTVVSSIGAMLANIGALVGNILNSVGFVLSKIGEGLSYIGRGLFEAVKFAASTLGKVFGNPFATTAAQSAPASFTVQSFGNTLFQTAVKVGLSVATQKGLEALGVNPTIASLASAFVTGGTTGGFNAGFTAQNFIQGGVKALALQGTQTVLQNAGIDTTLSQTLSLLTSPLIDGIRFGNIGAELVKIIPDFTKNLSFYSVEKLGNALGLDTRITSLIGAPISGALSAGLSGGVNVGQNIITAIQHGIASGVTSLGIEHVTQQAGLDPLLGSLTSRAITGAIAGAINPDQNIFDGIYSAFKESALNVARLGVSGTDSWSQAQYMSRVLSFSQTIQAKGLSQAIEDYAAGILHQDSVSSILKSFATVKAYVDNQIALNKLPTVTIDGQSYKKLLMPNGDYQLYTSDLKTLVEVKQGNRVLKGNFGTDEAKNFGLLSGFIIQSNSDGTTSTQTILNGDITEINIADGNEILLKIEPPLGAERIRLATNGQILDGILLAQNGEIEIHISNGSLLYTSADIFGGAQPNITVSQTDTPYDKSKKFLEVVDFYASLGVSSNDAPIFGYTNLLRSIILSTGYFGLAGDLTNLFAVNDLEIESLSDYAEILFEMYLSPDLIIGAPTLEQIGRYQSLEYGLEGELPQSIVSAIHGTGSHTPSWADHLNGLKVDGDPIQVSAITWNLPGSDDGVGGLAGADFTSGIKEYLIDPVKRELIKNRVYQAMLVDQQYARDNGLPYDVVAHSQGTMIVFDVLREHGSEFLVRNLVTTGSPLKWYISTLKRAENLPNELLAFDNVQNWINVYNENDVINTGRSKMVQGVSSIFKPLEDFLSLSRLNRPVSGPLSGLVTGVKDVSPVDVAHTAMWSDPKIKEAIELYWIDQQ